MTQPAPEWQQIIATSDSPDTAKIRIAYASLQELRTIKTVLAWGLFGVPAFVLLIVVVLMTAS